MRGITDSTQTVTDSLRYDAFGNTLSRTGTTPTPFGFVGKSQYQSDGDSNLMLLGHRYYDPSIGRFLSSDKAKAGDNWYDYCANNPLNRTDPQGLDAGKKFRGDNGKLDPNQLKNVKDRLDEIRRNGNKQSDRKERNELEGKLKKHEKNVGERPHGDAGDHFHDAVGVGIGVTTGWLLWEGFKWGVAIATAPETGGGSLIGAGALQ